MRFWPNFWKTDHSHSSPTYSFSDKWIEYGNRHIAHYKLVNFYDTDIISQLRDCLGLMRHWSHTAMIGSPFGVVSVITHCFDCYNLAPLAFVLTACDHGKVQGLITFGFVIAYVILVIAVARWSEWGVAGVAATGAMVWTIRNAVFLSSYAAFVMGLRRSAFYWPLTIGTLSTLCISLARKLTTHLWLPKSWLEILACGATIIMLSA